MMKKIHIKKFYGYLSSQIIKEVSNKEKYKMIAYTFRQNSSQIKLARKCNRATLKKTSSQLMVS